MAHDLKRLSWPEGREFWVAWDMSWMVFPTLTSDGSHKEWIVMCLKDNNEFVGGDTIDETYKELYEAKRAVLQLMESE